MPTIRVNEHKLLRLSLLLLKLCRHRLDSLTLIFEDVLVNHMKLILRDHFEVSCSLCQRVVGCGQYQVNVVGMGQDISLKETDLATMQLRLNYYDASRVLREAQVCNRICWVIDNEVKLSMPGEHLPTCTFMIQLGLFHLLESLSQSVSLLQFDLLAHVLNTALISNDLLIRHEDKL